MAITIRNLDLVRGDTFELDVALEHGFEDVLLNYDVYAARLCMRLEQDDSLPILLEIEAFPDVELGSEQVPPCNHDRVYFTFRADPTSTALLPPYDLAYFVELTGPSDKMRLFQGTVKITD